MKVCIVVNFQLSFLLIYILASKGISAFLVPKGSEGLSFGKKEHKVQHHLQYTYRTCMFIISLYTPPYRASRISCHLFRTLFYVFSLVGTHSLRERSLWINVKYLLPIV